MAEYAAALSDQASSPNRLRSRIDVHTACSIGRWTMVGLGTVGRAVRGHSDDR